MNRPLFGLVRMWWAMRAERRRRERARAAADMALTWRNIEASERRAAIGLGVTAALVLAVVVALIAAGCGGRYPLADLPDAGPDAAIPTCGAMAGCGLCSDETLVVTTCGASTTCMKCVAQNYDFRGPPPDPAHYQRALDRCPFPGRAGVSCVADCAECAP